MEKDKNWPAWRYGPGGKSVVFESEKDVPAGWQDHPTKVGEKAAAPDKTTTEKGTSQDPAATPPSGDGAPVELDAHGHPWSADLHASSKSKTTQGLWRMTVGVARPEPAPGYPLDL